MNNNIVPIVLSGGSGSRMWPLSRSQYPKQFLPLVTNQSLLQETLNRLPSGDNVLDPVIICNQDHRFMVAEQLHEISINSSSIILEPFGRNTAPAITIAAMTCKPDDILLVLPSDHVIKDKEALSTAIEHAVIEAQNDHLVTFGILPDSPHTGYGYIERGEQSADNNSFTINSFTEKPDLETAQTYIDSGNFYWNSGMFAFKASHYLNEINKFRPEIFNACKAAIENAITDLDFIRIDTDNFENCPSESIDNAVMENTNNAVVIPLNAGWNDVGSWASLLDVSDKDSDGNSVHGDVLSYNTHDCLLHSETRLVTAVGLENIIVVETDDSIMVASKDSVQDVKYISQKLSSLNRSEAEAHRKVYRPWGWYDSIDCGARHQAKRISVKIGAKLSLQKHHHRSEHWVVIKGTALITLDDKEIILTEDQSTYIPLGTKHRLENIGKIPLEIIEVQTGSYLGEDDIVRYSDDYGRNKA